MSNAKGNSSRSVLFAAVSALVCAALASIATAASAAPFAYTANYEDDSVSVINTATNTVVGKPIAVGANPFSVALTPDGRRAFVVNGGDDTVSAIDTVTRQVIGGPIKVGEEPSTIAISPDGLTAYVTDEKSGEVSEIDTQSLAAVAGAKGLGRPLGVAIAPDGGSIWVADAMDDVVRVLDAQTLKPIGGAIPVGSQPTAVIFGPNGRLAYVSDKGSDEVSVIDTAARALTAAIPTGSKSKPWGLAVTPDGRRLFVSDDGIDSVDVVDTATNKIVGVTTVGDQPYELGMSPNGKVVYLAEFGSEDVIAIDTATGQVVGTPIAIPGAEPWQVVVAPDRSPTAAFSAPSAVAATPTTFDASAASDPDGSVASWEWLFGDGVGASGKMVTHTYGTAGTFTAQLGVLDDEGCGGAQVFTGRTALCSGGTSPVIHPVTVAAPPAPPVVTPPSNKLRFGRLIHNRRNGTARLQVRLPAAGSVLLTGPKVHLVRRKLGAPGSLFLTIHARVRLNKKLKETLRARVGFKVTFSPTGGTPATRAHSLVLQRAPKKKH